jgi:acyl-CoA reductase-like NAD-dependent aldehyde dehydrogenase
MAKYAAPGTDGSVVSFKPRYDNFIGGEYVAPVKGQYFENPTPITGQTFTEVSRAPRRTSSSLSTPRGARLRRGARRRSPSARTS